VPDYSRLAASAQRVIAAAGVPVTLKRDVVDDYDPTQGLADTLGGNTWTGVGVRDQFKLKDIDGTLIRTGDVRIYLVITLDGSAPRTGDLITMVGDTWKIVISTPIKPGPTVLLYDIQARK